jgi:VIT1/CCC1 family predicted Fe2+/Mn2+ transporter
MKRRWSGLWQISPSEVTGLNFGLTSGVITTLGLMVGLHSGTHSRLAVIGGVLAIAVTDACSDALGIHISEESENQHDSEGIWRATVFTFLTKFLVALSFILPVLIFSLSWAIVVSLIWGFFILGTASYYLAKRERLSPQKVIGEHLGIALVVIVLTHCLGDWINARFGYS